MSKMAFGNRKGNNSEKRITLSLVPDFYEIATDSLHNGGKNETGKDNRAHDNVTRWEYFVTNLVFEENDGTRIDCHMNIDVKRKNSGDFFYSFAIERGSAPQTLLAVVNDEKSPTEPLDKRIPQNKPSVKKNSKAQHSFSDTPLRARNYTDAQKKAKSVVKEAIRNELNLKNNKLNNDLLDTFADNVIDEITSDYALSDCSLDSIVNFMAERGTITDNDFAEMYPELKQELKGTRIKVSDEVRNDITDYDGFRRSLQGALTLSKENGLPVDIAYRELGAEYPDLFPEDIINPSDQLQTIAEVALKCKPKEVSIKDYYGNQFDSFIQKNKAIDI